MDQDSRFRYGEHPSQFGEFQTPRATPRGLVVIIHGGYWQQQYGLELGRPLAEALLAEGLATWNIEYRRVGGDGGVPQTLDDVHNAIEKVAEIPAAADLPVVTLGHSAGGQLAAWAAGRAQLGREVTVPVGGVISQAGLLDLATAYDDNLGGGATRAFVGDRDNVTVADPLQQLPIQVPVRCVHSPDDALVPISQSTAYVAAAVDAGTDAELVEVSGDHFAHLDTGSDVWAVTLDHLNTLLGD